MNLAEDIVLEILSRLPVRCLIRFKCVSKTWYALIQRPDFVDMHLTLQLTKGDQHIQTLRCINRYVPWSRQHLLTRFDDLESLSHLTPPDVEVPGYTDENSTLVVFGNHLNGIVCMFSAFYQAKITLWNPALREFRVLPPRPFHCPSEFKEGGEALGIGFGFDDATNDYKVVCVERFHKDDPPDHCNVVQVYNLKSNSWRILEGMGEFVPNYLTQWGGQPIFFKGSFHWLVSGFSKPFIVTFNITTELFGDIQFPHACVRDYTYGRHGIGLSSLFILDKSTLSLVSDFSDCCTSQQLDVWMLKDYTSWTKQYSIDRSNIGHLLSSWKNDQLLCSTYDCGDCGLICLDLPTGQQHYIRQDYGHELGPLYVVVCIDTLVSVGRG